MREFWNLEFRVTPAVLIPRPESEFIIEAALCSGCATRPARGRSPTSAPAAGAWPSRWRTSCQPHESSPPTSRRRRWQWRATTPSAWASADRVTFVQTSLLDDAPGPVRSDRGQPSVRAGVAPSDVEPGRARPRAGRRALRSRRRRPRRGASAAGAGAVAAHGERRAADGVRVRAGRCRARGRSRGRLWSRSTSCAICKATSGRSLRAADHT